MLSDEDIIARVLEGRPQRYGELVRKYQDAAFRIAYRITGRREDAEDAVQDTFLRAYGKLGSCRDRSRFWPWVRRIAVNVCLAKMSRETPCEYVEEMRDASSPLGKPVEAEVVGRAAAREVRRAIAGLPKDYRLAIVLRYQEELSYKEIAEALGESFSTVRIRLHRAKKMLAERLAVLMDEMRRCD